MFPCELSYSVLIGVVPRQVSEAYIGKIRLIPPIEGETQEGKRENRDPEAEEKQRDYSRMSPFIPF